MSRLPTVAIIGKPNTGKSTLFNALVGQHRAIVSDIAGTTRDPVAAVVAEAGVPYLLLDTGGMGGGSTDVDMEKDVSAQSALALESADLILFTIVASEELTLSDRNVIDILRRKRKRHVPVILIATKEDRWKDPSTGSGQAALGVLEGLGMGEAVIPVSAVHRRGIEETEQMIEAQLKKLHFTKGTSDMGHGTASIPRVALVGRPNVGKSSLVNALMSDPQRKTSPRIVSPTPGTTRDSSDTIIRHKEKPYIFVDTAGLRRKARVEEGIETFSAMRSIQAIANADVVVLVMDASEPVQNQDKKIANLAVEEGKALILLLNKIDLLPKAKRPPKVFDRDNPPELSPLMKKVVELRREMPFCSFAPIHASSAVTREELPNLFPIIDIVYANRSRRIPTKALHDWFEQARRGKPLGELRRTKHITQADGIPPMMVLFTKNPKEVRKHQLTYLDHQLRSVFSFDGVPIRWVVKGGQDH